MTTDSTASSAPTPAPAPRTNINREMVAADVESGKFGRQICTRFPPEPNGFLHIGHSKSLCLNFGIAQEFGGRIHLRFDDTNPFTEDIKYVNAIKDDMRWLGFAWDAEYYASDYFEQLYAIAVRLVEHGKAYVDSQNEEEIRHGRGTITQVGTNSPHRLRDVSENLDLLSRMKAGEFADGRHVLRARRSRFSFTARSRCGLFVPTCVTVPRSWRISSSLCESTYAFPCSTSLTAIA